MDNLKLKVCGLRKPDNIRSLPLKEIDYIGMIFYSKSKRYVKPGLSEEMNQIIHPNKTGVFVNEKLSSIIETALQFRLNTIQLHGNESEEDCKTLKKMGFIVLKAFGIHSTFNFDLLKTYSKHIDYFVFDTKTSSFGGSGQKFDWEILENYQLDTPFLLSGGISIEDVSAINKLDIPKLYGLDINSRFEIEPGIKDVELIKEFIKKLKAND